MPSSRRSPQDAVRRRLGGGRAGGGQGTPVTMPALGESVTEGTVTRWLKQEGDRVEVDEPLLEVSTDKVDTEIPSPVAGHLVSIAVGEDETVAVGAELAIIGRRPDQRRRSADATSAASRRRREPRQQQPPTEPRRAPSPTEPESRPPRPSSRGAAGPPAPAGRQQPEPAAATRLASRASQPGLGRAATERTTQPVRHPAGPQAGRRARRRPAGAAGHRRRRPDPQAGRPRGRGAGQGSAPACAGARRRDRTSRPAQAPAAPVEASPLRGTTEKMSRLRKVIAARMVESLQISAQLTTVVEVDVTRSPGCARGPRPTSRPARASSSRSCRSSPRPPSRR